MLERQTGELQGSVEAEQAKGQDVEAELKACTAFSTQMTLHGSHLRFICY
jgi:hypothetical protein